MSAGTASSSSLAAGIGALLFASMLFVYGAALAIAFGLNSPAVLFEPWGTPAAANATAAAADARPVVFRADDGTRLSGLVLDGRSGAPWVLFFYGNAESALIERPRLQWLHSHFGVNVACFDYRGYGRSDGAPEPTRLRADALREFDWVRAQAGRAPVIVYGYSLGSQLAIHVAANRPAAGAIVEAAPSSAADMEAWMLRWPFFAAIRWLTSPLMTLRPDPRVTEFLSAATEVRRLRVPLVVIHGTRDRVVPFAQGQLVYAAATTPQKRFVAVQDAGHLQLDYSRAPIADAIGWVIRESVVATAGRRAQVLQQAAGRCAASIGATQACVPTAVRGTLASGALTAGGGAPTLARIASLFYKGQAI